MRQMIGIPRTRQPATSGKTWDRNQPSYNIELLDPLSALW